MEPKKCSIKNCPYYSISPEINNCSQHYKQSINLSHEKLQNSTLQDHIINQKNISGNITNNQDNIRNIIFNLSSIFSYYLYNFETTCDQDENFKLFSNKKFKSNPVKILHFPANSNYFGTSTNSNIRKIKVIKKICTNKTCFCNNYSCLEAMHVSQLKILYFKMKGFLLKYCEESKIIKIDHFEDQVYLTNRLEKEIFSSQNVDVIKNNLIAEIVICENDEIIHVGTGVIGVTCDNNDANSQLPKSLENRDSLLQNRIRNLQWVTPFMLGIEMFDDREFSGDMKLLEKSMSKIIEIDVCLTPSSKLSRVIDCIKILLTEQKTHSLNPILNDSSIGSSFSTDDLHPLVISLILKSNPAMILSNLYFIESFYDNFLLNSGEIAFLFTQFSSAVRWLESDEGNSSKNYKCTREQFEMYKAGVKEPAEYLKRSSAIIENGILEVENTVNLLNKLLEQHF